MNYRIATLMAQTDFTADAPKIVPINVVDPISRITVLVSPDNALAGAPCAGHPVRCIPKLEIIDGSDVLYSLTGAEGHAVDFYDNGKLAHGDLSYLMGVATRTPIQMNFGRYLWDTELAFDPKKFINPQIKFNVDFDAGGTKNSHVYVTIIAHIFDEKSVSPIGFLMNKEIKDYPLGKSAHEYTDLPVDYPYRKLFIRQQEYGVWPDWNLANIKLSEDQDKRIPVDHTATQIIESIMNRFPPVEGSMRVGMGVGTYQFMCVSTRSTRLVSTNWRTTALATDVGIYSVNGGRFDIIGTNSSNVMLLERGFCPHGVICIPFGLQNDMADWYDVTRLSSLKLDITAAAGADAADSAQIFLQQLRRY